MTKILIDEATVKLALEALENWVEYFSANVDDIDKKAIKDLREALASEAKEQPRAFGTLAQQEPVDILIAAWQALEETSDRVPDEGKVEGRIHMSVIRSAWKQMDSLVSDLWDERGRP